MGGNPTSDVDSALLPTSTLLEDSGTNWMEYVYRRYIEYGASNLTYYLELNDDLLVSGAWTNDGYQAEIGTATLGGGFESVTNRVPTEDSATFIQLIIE